jgi:hypothetical protein
MPQFKTNNKLHKCFVCDVSINDNDLSYHKQILLPVCPDCKNSEKEQQKAKELLEGLADGFVCGCI